MTPVITGKILPKHDSPNLVSIATPSIGMTGKINARKDEIN